MHKTSSFFDCDEKALKKYEKKLSFLDLVFLNT